jgi:sialate O-acetylesterase
MVLQRDAMTAVWGWGQAGESVTVDVAGKTASAKADQYGRWLARIGPIPAGGPYTLTAKGSQTATIQDVMFGEVWLCSGQSNMALPVGQAANGSTETSNGTNPMIRLFQVETATGKTPRQLPSMPKPWRAAEPASVYGFSAACFYMGRALQKELNVAIGLVQSAVNGTIADAWTSAAGLATIEDFRDKLATLAAGPATPDQGSPSALYNAMIAPLMPFTLKGIAWYQGESNNDRGQQYARLLSTLILSWRVGFNQGSIPFIIVQLPNNMGPQTQPVENGTWIAVRESQLRTALRDDKNGIVVTTDLGGDPPDLHPGNKQDVGARLAIAALGLAYGKTGASTGPLYAAMKVEGSSIRLSFANASSGLMVGKKVGMTPVQEVPGGKLNSFAIAGADKKWVFANATIQGPTVVVSAPTVSQPVAVRYGWSDNPPVNLYNHEGLLASPFRTDPDYRLNVTGGNGGGDYVAGAQVTIEAQPPSGKRFDHWSGDVQVLSDPRSAKATVTMPAGYVTLVANYAN